MLENFIWQKSKGGFGTRPYEMGAVWFGQRRGGWELEPTEGQGGFWRPARSPASSVCLETRVGREGRLRNLRLGPHREKYVDCQCR